MTEFFLALGKMTFGGLIILCVLWLMKTIANYLHRRNRKDPDEIVIGPEERKIIQSRIKRLTELNQKGAIPEGPCEKV